MLFGSLNIEQIQDKSHVAMECPRYHQIHERYLSGVIHNIYFYRYYELISITDAIMLNRLFIFIYYCIKLHFRIYFILVSHRTSLYTVLRTCMLIPYSMYLIDKHLQRIGKYISDDMNSMNNNL